MSRKAAITQPRPGATRLPSSWARRPLPPITRQTSSCSAMSRTIESAIAKVNAAPSWTVTVVVWVVKPGPMAEVAMRNTAPSSVERVPEAIRLPVAGGAGLIGRSGTGAPHGTPGRGDAATLGPPPLPRNGR